jgi:hypothetical protein
LTCVTNIAIILNGSLFYWSYYGLNLLTSQAYLNSVKIINQILRCTESLFLYNQRLASLPELEEPPGDVEAAFPLASLEWSQDFSLAIEVTPPLPSKLWVSEVFPSVLMKLVEPFKALLPACSLVCLDESDHAFDVNPPQLLIPLQLLQGIAFNIFEVEDSPMFLIPAELGGADQDIS